MIIGSEYKLCFIIDRVPEWEDEAYKNGIMFVSLGTHIYPDTLRTTTLNMDLCYAVKDDSPFMKPVIDPVLYELEKDQLFKTIYEITYPEDIEKDNDYKYEWPFQEIMDAGDVKRVRKNMKKMLIDPILLERSKLFVNENYQMMEAIEKKLVDSKGNITLNECAFELNVTPSYIWKLLKTERGKTFSEYQEEIKLEEYPEDEEKLMLDDLQDTINKYNSEVDELIKEKEKELLEI